MTAIIDSMPTRSGQGPAAVVEAASNLDHGVAALVFVFDVGGYWPAVLLQQLKHLHNRHVAFAKRHVRSLNARPVLEVQRHNACVMLPQERNGVLIRGGEVADVEVQDRKSTRLN